MALIGAWTSGGTWILMASTAIFADADLFAVFNISLIFLFVVRDLCWSARADDGESMEERIDRLDSAKDLWDCALHDRHLFGGESVDEESEIDGGDAGRMVLFCNVGKEYGVLVEREQRIIRKHLLTAFQSFTTHSPSTSTTSFHYSKQPFSLTPKKC